MTRIVILGGPRTGKTTLADQMFGWHKLNGQSMTLYHTDDIIHLGWSEASQHVADEWLTQPGPWIIEGVAVARALRKWREAHPGERPPVDRVIRLTEPHVELNKGQSTMAKGEASVWWEIEAWIEGHVRVDYSMHPVTAPQVLRSSSDEAPT